jgi:hypothetical protein
MNLEKNIPIIEISDFSLLWINKYPVWTWYEGSLFESESYVHPIDLLEIDQNDITTIMFAASFCTIEGVMVRGVVTYDADTDNIYCIGLFYNGGDFNFSINFEDLFIKELKRLRSHAKNENLMVFPVKYECDVNCIIKEKSVGFFNPFNIPS